MQRQILSVVAVFLLMGVACAAEPSAQAPDLLAGSVWKFSADGGKTFEAAEPALGTEKSAEVHARVQFPGPAAPETVSLTLATNPYPLKAAYELNGQTLEAPLKGMRYAALPGIAPTTLKAGENTLEAHWTVRVTEGKATADLLPKVSLMALRAENLQVQTGPVLGAFGPDFFSLTCRTNLPTSVKLLRVEGDRSTAVAESASGLLHRLRAARTDGETCEYALVAGDGRVRVKIAPPKWTGEAFTFAALGDSRTNPLDWGKVAAAVAEARPAFVVSTGDLVADGMVDASWDEQFFGPARGLLASVPFYTVIGNHERNSPLFFEMFFAPGPDGRGRNWSQTIGPVTLIGINGYLDWSAGGANAKWLDETLAQSKTRFIFLAVHNPPWSSSSHGKVSPEGVPAETPSRQMREVVMPLLAQYKATALLAGHDHCYERSEPPGGVTVIITGGAGAPRYGKAAQAEQQNPWSKSFGSDLHYCLFKVEGDVCRMTVLTPEGKTLDTWEWKGR